MLLWLLWNLVTLVAEEEAPVRRETKICRVHLFLYWAVQHMVLNIKLRMFVEANSLKLMSDRATLQGKRFKSYAIEKRV